MIAVKEALNVPDAVFLPMVIVDTIVPYVWMGILVALASRQKIFDAWNHSDRRILDDLATRTEHFTQRNSTSIHWEGFFDHRTSRILIGRLSQAASVIYRREGMCCRLMPGPLSGHDHRHCTFLYACKPYPAYRCQQIR
jgi:hypothetical protein